MKKTYDRCNERTENLIKDTFISLVSEKSIKKITIKEICERANLNRGTFYFHYEDINHLIEAMYNQVFEEIDNALTLKTTNVTEDYLKNIFLDLLNNLYKNKKMYETLLFMDFDNKFTDKLIELIEKRCFHNWETLFKIKNEKNIDYYSSYVVNGCSGIVQSWIKNDMKEPPEEIATLLKKITSSVTSLLQNI